MNLIKSCECVTILGGKGVSSDGSVLHAHNEDRGRVTGGIWFLPKGLISAKQVITFPFNVNYKFMKDNFSFCFCGDQSGKNLWEKILLGMNQYNVTISCNTSYSREIKIGKKGIHSRSIRFITLAQAESARQAVEIITSLIERFGQALISGQIYCVADSKEAWIVETTSRHWVAKKCPDDQVHVISNRFTINETYDLSNSKYYLNDGFNKKIVVLDLKEYAIKKKWMDSNIEKVDFREVFSKKSFREVLYKNYNFNREYRIREIISECGGGLKIEDLKNVLRDNKVPVNECRKLRFKTFFNKFLNTPLCNNRTQSGNIWVLNYDAGKGFWIHAPGTPFTSIFFPIVDNYFLEKGFYDRNSYWLNNKAYSKVWNILNNFKKSRYKKMRNIIIDDLKKLEEIIAIDYDASGKKISHDLNITEKLFLRLMDFLENISISKKNS